MLTSATFKLRAALFALDRDLLRALQSTFSLCFARAPLKILFFALTTANTVGEHFFSSFHFDACGVFCYNELLFHRVRLKLRFSFFFFASLNLGDARYATRSTPRLTSKPQRRLSPFYECKRAFRRATVDELRIFCLGNLRIFCLGNLRAS